MPDPNMILTFLGPSLIQLLSVLAVLVVGWLVAVIVRGITRRLTATAGLNQRIEQLGGTKVDLEGMLATAAYFVILLLTAIAVAGRLDMPQMTVPLQAIATPALAMLPRFAAAGLLAVVAWLLATIVRSLLKTAADATSLDERLAEAAGVSPIGETLAVIGYWSVWLLMLPGILEALGLEGLLAPVQGLVTQLMDFLPNVVAAILIGAIGWLVAKALRAIVTNLAVAAGIDAIGERSGTLGEGATLSSLLGMIVQIVVFVPALTAAVDALGIDAVSSPLTAMLGQVTLAVPQVIAAAIILGLVHFIARLVQPMIESLLQGLGANDRIPERLGLSERLGETQPAHLAGQVFYFFAMLFAATEASNRLGFTTVSELTATFISFGGQVLLGALILLIGFVLANVAHRTITATGGDHAGFLANIARVAIMGLVLAMGLDTMGIAPIVVQAAVLLTLGSVSVAVALAFGLGGREAAGELSKHWLRRFTGEE